MQFTELENALRPLYGNDAGRVYRTVVPGILADFHRMIAAAGPDAEVTETYNIEDGRGRIILSCRKRAGQTGPIDVRLDVLRR